jgi:hypothetical protein
MSKRRYRQQVRAEAAEETRQRVLDALYELLRDQPAEPVSVSKRLSSSNRFTSVSSFSLPTKLLSSSGRLGSGRFGVCEAGSASLGSTA